MTFYRYPWDTWLDGDEWVLVRGQDFDVDAHIIRASADGAARRRGGRLLSKTVRGEVITIKFLPKG